MRILNDAILELDYFDLLAAAEAYINEKLCSNAEVCWITPNQETPKSSIPYQGSYRILIKEKATSGK